MYIIEEKTIKSYTIQVVYDECSDSPRNWDELGTFYSNHREYNPDNHSIEELVEMFPPREGVDEIFNEDAMSRQFVWIRVYAYIHGNIALRTSPFNDPWDSGLFAIYAVNKDKVRKEWNKKVVSRQLREKVEKVLAGEVDCYGKFISGDVYGYRILDPSEDVIDACYGYYCNDYEELFEEAESIINSL